MAKKKKNKIDGRGKKNRRTESAPENIPPMQSMEKILANIGGGFRRKRSAVDEAQSVIYDAWESGMTNPVATAEKALSISPDCADAYNLLADFAGTLESRTAIYRGGVAAGERALGEKAFKDDVGYFWGLLETRPYMRARAGLAQCLWELGKRDEAISHYQDMLRLNPGDNQGIRYLLMGCLIQANRDTEAEALYRQYEDEGMANWAYSRALLDFRKGGDCEKSRKSLAEAIETNKFVPAYLTGKKKLPKKMPGYYGIGDDNEAVIYADENIESWKMTPGVREWLAANAR